MLAEIKKVQGQDMLIITMPVDNSLPLSKSGKSRIVATSNGNKAVQLTVKNPHRKEDCNVTIGVNAFVPARDKEAMERQAMNKA